MKIAVYSGSFNPLHVGHLAIMQTLSEWDGCDWTYLVISPLNPFKAGKRMASGKKRYLAALEALKRHPGLKVWLDDIELRMPQPSYTILTLDAMKKREPENEFKLVIGADNLAVFRSWKDYKRILTDYSVAVYPRGGFDTREIAASLLAEDPSYKIEILESPMVDVSSTRIREAMESGEDVKDLLM